MMDSTSPVRVDFTQQDAIVKILPRSFLLASYEAAWDNLHTLYHRQPPHEVPESNFKQHILSVYLNDFRATRYTNGKWHEDFYKAGDIGIYPANQITPHSGCDRESEFINLFLEPSFFHKVAYETIDGEDVEIVPKLRFRDRLIEQIGRELKFELQTGGFESRMYADTIASTLAIHIIKRHATRKFEPKTYTDGLPSSKLKIAIAYIHDHLDRNISLSEIAQQVQIILIPVLHSSNNSQISIHFNDPFRRLFFLMGTLVTIWLGAGAVFSIEKSLSLGLF